RVRSAVRCRSSAGRPPGEEDARPSPGSGRAAGHRGGSDKGSAARPANSDGVVVPSRVHARGVVGSRLRSRGERGGSVRSRAWRTVAGAAALTLVALAGAPAAEASAAPAELSGVVALGRALAVKADH